MSVDLSADQIRLNLEVLGEKWWDIENTKGYADQRLTSKQVELEGIQERLREALVQPRPRPPRQPDPDLIIYREQP